jgi:hypothetical protein
LSLSGLKEAELGVHPKGAIEKQILARWMCEHTTVRRRW